MKFLDGKREPLLVAMAALGAHAAAALAGRPYYLSQLTMAAYTASVVMGLSLLVGYTGQVSLGHAAFFALGGYTSAVLTTAHLPPMAPALTTWLLRLHLVHRYPELYTAGTFLAVDPRWAAVAALLGTGLAAAILGYPALRLRGHYLAMATLGFGLIIYRVLLASAFTGSADGISGVPEFPLIAGIGITDSPSLRTANYYIAVCFMIGVLVLLKNIVDSRVGRALRAIHGSERAANAAGVNTAAYKLRVFVLSAMLAAAAGVLSTHFRGSIGPSSAGVMKSVRLLAMVAAGGMASLSGGLFVGFVLTFLSLRGVFGSYDDAVFGIVLITIMSWAPDGPFEPLRRLIARIRCAPGSAAVEETADAPA